MLEKPLFEVMLSSTFRDLKDHRTHVTAVLRQHRLHAIAMEDDASLSDQDMIDASLAKVEAASGYVCIVGKRYGQVRPCPDRNPHELSLTELEFEKAVSQNIPITVLVMEPAYPVGDEQNEFDPVKRDKLQAFRERVGLPHRVTADFDCWEEFLKRVPTAITDLRSSLDKRARDGTTPAASSAGTPPPRADEVLPPTPPTFHIVKPFTQGHALVGRDKELARITRWVTGPDPLLVFEAIGGMGKSMVTYHWIDQYAPTVGTDWAGRLWYSFYEEGASTNDFCVHALAYIERRSPRDFLGRQTPDLETLLLSHLREKPWLIVMDGLERVLVAYHRFDKAQLRDDEAVTDPNKTGRDPYRCVHPADDHLLQALTTGYPSKLLISTRNMPTVLLNASARPIARVDHHQLTGLEPEDAEEMMRRTGVRGDSWRMQSYLQAHFQCHPLMVGVVAGMVNAYVATPGDFDRWLADPYGAGAINIATLEGLVQKRDHILQVAYEALEPDARKLLGVLAFFSQSVAGEVLVELNPKRPARPREVRRPLPVDEGYDYDLSVLRRALDRENSSDDTNKIERQITARRAELKDFFEHQTEAHRQYEAALTQWRASPELRAADAWLGKAAVDLQRRGLIITDRLTARYDLHPMVRGFVRHVLRGDESAATGRAVANYAQSRSVANYENVSSLTDLAQGFQIVTALTLGGYFHEAAQALIDGDLDVAAFRWELYAEELSLLQPFFSHGWESPPDRAPEHAKAQLIEFASGCFYHLGDYQRAEALSRLGIKRRIADEDLGGAANGIRNLSIVLETKGRLAGAARLSYLYETAAIASKNEHDIDQYHYDSVDSDITRGDLVLARQRLEPLLSKAEIEKLWPRFQLEILGLETALLFREQRLIEARLDTTLTQARKSGHRTVERRLHGRRGMLLQARGDHYPAIEAFEKAIAMAREVRIPASETEARYAISLLAVGRRVEALEVATRLSAVDNPPHVQLAQLYLALGDQKARLHALAGFREAWADGPPYAAHWDLEDCRKVLEALGEPVPQLPSFDPAKTQPFDFELDLHLLIEKKKAEAEEEKKKGDERRKAREAIGNPDPPSNQQL